VRRDGELGHVFVAGKMGCSTVGSDEMALIASLARRCRRWRVRGNLHLLKAIKGDGGNVVNFE